ncbi:MAG: hypothetical protein IPG23_05305 [Burkholderiales bacterium]|nr:hypothetical protein [Burkholderiales bacterium]
MLALDLKISISFPRYASDAVMLTRCDPDRCAHVVALADSMASPLVNWSHGVLVAPRHPTAWLSGQFRAC